MTTCTICGGATRTLPASYLTNLPDVSKIAGFYMGPDGNCWGRDFVSTEPESPPQQVIDKMWYSFLLWGRLSL